MCQCHYLPDRNDWLLSAFSPRQFLADNHIKIFDEGGIMEMLGILESKFEGFDEGKEGHNLLTQDCQFGDLVAGQAVESGVDERSHLFGRFEPGPV